MDFSFIDEDLEKVAKCESCEKRADHVAVIQSGVAIVISQICYDCAVILEFAEAAYRFFPKKDAKRRCERSEPLRYP